MPGDYVNVITPEGKTVSIPVDAVASTLSADPRYRLESAPQEANRAIDAGLRAQSKGVAGAIRASIMGTLAGATLGGSSAMFRLAANDGELERARLDRDEHRALATGAEVAGALLTAIPSGGTSIETALARKSGQAVAERVVAREAAGAVRGAAELGLADAARLTPSGALANLGAKVAERGAGAGVVKSTAYKVAGGALEGAGQSVGSYVSDVALGDRDLSAEGLFGAAKDGAILGGSAAGIIGVTERGLSRARDLFPRSQITRELAERSEREAATALDSMVQDTADLEQRANAAISDIKVARAKDPEVQAHAARIRAEREAKAAADRAVAEARAADAAAKARGSSARADLAELRLGKAKDGRPTRIPRGTPSDGVPTSIADDSLAGTALAPAPIVDEATDLEKALAATNRRLEGGETWSALQAEGRGATGASRPAQAVDDLEEAVVAVDPTAAKLRELATQARLGREGVQEYLATIGKRADDMSAKRAAAGLLKRDDDVLRSLEGGRDVFGAKLGASGQAGRDARAVRSRMRNPYTDEELIAKAERNPTFLDEAGARTTARDDLVERIVSGRTKPSAIQIEELLPKVDPATGEVLPGLRREARAATSDDILRAVESNRRNPEFARSYVPDDVMRALRGRLDVPHDLERAIPAISALEKSEAALANHLGARATPGSARRAAEYATADAAHAETRAMATTQRMSAIEDAALPEIQRAANSAQAEDIIRGTVRPTEAIVELPSATALGGKEGAAEKASKMADIAAALEVMSSMGIPGLPSPHDIPVVGPILGMYLKARAGMTVWKKMGGKVPSSVESTVAKRAAATRERMARAVGQMLETSSRTIARTPVQAATVAEVLGRSVFSEGKGKKRARQDETMAEMWTRHRAEIASAKQPGAVERVIRERVPTGDPRLAQSLVSVARRRLAYLDAKMPRPPAGPTDPDMPPWHPTATQAAQWAAIVDATEDPAAVMERAARGDVSVDQIEAVRAVFPRLYAEAQLAVIEGVAGGKSIPYQRRIQLGAIFGLPLAATQDADFAASMQAGYDAPPPDAPAPRPSANVDLAGPALLQEQT